MPETAARQSALKHLMAKLFRGSSELLFTQLVSDQKLTPAQIRLSTRDQAERLTAFRRST